MGNELRIERQPNLCGICGTEWFVVHSCGSAPRSTATPVVFISGPYERTFDGCAVVWDQRASYAHTNPKPDAFAVATTKDIGGGIHVDLDRYGYVRGVEVIGREVTVSELLAVLRHCKWGSHRGTPDRCDPEEVQP